MEEPDDELVPFARIVQELGWSRYKGPAGHGAGWSEA